MNKKKKIKTTRKSPNRYELRANNEQQKNSDFYAIRLCFHSCYCWLLFSHSFNLTILCLVCPQHHPTTAKKSSTVQLSTVARDISTFFSCSVFFFHSFIFHEFIASFTPEHTHCAQGPRAQKREIVHQRNGSSIHNQKNMKIKSWNINNERKKKFFICFTRKFLLSTRMEILVLLLKNSSCTTHKKKDEKFFYGILNLSIPMGEAKNYESKMCCCCLLRWWIIFLFFLSPTNERGFDSFDFFLVFSSIENDLWLI